MIVKLFEQRILIYGMLGICGIGVLLKFALSLIYGSLVRASDKMGVSKNKLMIALRTRYETSYSLMMSVNNVDSFVDKYVYKHKICGIFLYTWENLCGQLLLLCTLTGPLGAILAAIYNQGTKNILLTLFVGIFSSAVLLFVDNMANLSTKRVVMKNNIQDYLENFLKARLELQEVKAARREGMEMENQESESVEVMKDVAIAKEVDKSPEDEQKEYENSKKEEQIIQEILKEYIV